LYFANKFYRAIKKTGMVHKKEKLKKSGDELLKNMPTPDPFIFTQINAVLFCWNIKSMTGFSKVVMNIPGVTGFMQIV
jgi:hypothetical protein